VCSTLCANLVQVVGSPCTVVSFSRSDINSIRQMGLIASVANAQSVAAQPVVGALSILVVALGVAVSDRTRDVSCTRSAVSAREVTGVSAVCETAFRVNNSNLTLGAALCNRIDAAALAEPNCDDCAHWEAFMTHVIFLLVAAILLTLAGYALVYQWRTHPTVHKIIVAHSLAHFRAPWLRRLEAAFGTRAKIRNVVERVGAAPDERVFSTDAFARPGTIHMQNQTLAYFRDDWDRYSDLRQARSSLSAGNTMKYRRKSKAVRRALNNGPVELYSASHVARRDVYADKALIFLAIVVPCYSFLFALHPDVSSDCHLASLSYVCSGLILEFPHDESVSQSALFTIAGEGGVHMPQECLSSSAVNVVCDVKLSCAGPGAFAVVEWLVTLSLATQLMSSAFVQRALEEVYDLPWGKLSDYGLLVHVLVLVVSGVAGVLAHELNASTWRVLAITQGVGAVALCLGGRSLRRVARDRWQDEVVRHFISLLPIEPEDLTARAVWVAATIAGPAHLSDATRLASEEFPNRKVQDVGVAEAVGAAVGSTLMDVRQSHNDADARVAARAASQALLVLASSSAARTAAEHAAFTHRRGRLANPPAADMDQSVACGLAAAGAFSQVKRIDLGENAVANVEEAFDRRRKAASSAAEVARVAMKHFFERLALAPPLPVPKWAHSVAVHIGFLAGRWMYEKPDVAWPGQSLGLVEHVMWAYRQGGVWQGEDSISLRARTAALCQLVAAAIPGLAPGARAALVCRAEAAARAAQRALERQMNGQDVATVVEVMFGFKALLGPNVAIADDVRRKVTHFAVDITQHLLPFRHPRSVTGAAGALATKLYHDTVARFLRAAHPSAEAQQHACTVAAEEFVWAHWFHRRETEDMMAFNTATATAACVAVLDTAQDGLDFKTMGGECASAAADCVALEGRAGLNPQLTHAEAQDAGVAAAAQFRSAPEGYRGGACVAAFRAYKAEFLSTRNRASARSAAETAGRRYYRRAIRWRHGALLMLILSVFVLISWLVVGL